MANAPLSDSQKTSLYKIYTHALDFYSITIPERAAQEAKGVPSNEFIPGPEALQHYDKLNAAETSALQHNLTAQQIFRASKQASRDVKDGVAKRKLDAFYNSFTQGRALGN